MDRLRDALGGPKSTPKPVLDHDPIDRPLTDVSSGYDSDTSSIADILQFDGAGGSKQEGGDSNDTRRSGMRKKMHNLKEKLSPKKSNKEGNKSDAEDEVDDTSPMRVVSPRATDAVSPESQPRRSFSMRRRSRGSRSASVGNVMAPPSRAQTQEPLGFAPISTQSVVPAATGTPLSSPTRPRHGSAIRTPPLLPQSPSRLTALSSHPVTPDDLDIEGPSTYHTPGSSIGGKEDGN